MKFCGGDWNEKKSSWTVIWFVRSCCPRCPTRRPGAEGAWMSTTPQVMWQQQEEQAGAAAAAKMGLSILQSALDGSLLSLDLPEARHYFPEAGRLPKISFSLSTQLPLRHWTSRCLVHSNRHALTGRQHVGRQWGVSHAYARCRHPP